MGVGGALIGFSLGAQSNYAATILPGLLVIGIGVGFAIPTLVAAGTGGLRADQTSTGSAIVQMGRQIGSVLGVAVLVVILGSSTASTSNLVHFVHIWWLSGFLALLSAGASLYVTPRRAILRGVEGCEIESESVSLGRPSEAGDIGPAHERTFPLDQAPEAMRHLFEDRPYGNVSLVPARPLDDDSRS
jgi:hypothetical protein